ncbi:MAG: xanthine dehydrogenase family protein molybdopterin-binding subunit, partial [Thermoplasmata archaeon]|nr:xanthine dehydrogenase family protein molybdopterin-binding subunit [Thermoplasmata archaeon]
MSRSDAALKLRGGARYGTDLFEPGMLHAVLVPAPSASGHLRRLDLSVARSMPGVVAVVGPAELAKLIPNGGSAERPVFPIGEISYRSQPIAAVAAETLAQARAAASVVDCEVDPRPSTLDVEAIFPEWPGPEGPGSPHVVAHVRARRGDLDATFAAADFVQSDVYRTSGVHQVAIEPHACLARPEGGGYRVLTSTQTPFGTREDTAEILGIPEERIVIEGTWVGGGFGGKGASFLEPYAIVLAAATGRPVRLTLTHREEFLLGRTTLPAVFRLDSSVKDGRVTGRRVRMLLDSGASLPGRDFATGYAIGFLLGPYRLETFDLEGYAVRTNKPPFGPHRAPVAPQCAFAADQHMDAIAQRLGVDPIDFRHRHAWTEGDTTPMGQAVGPFGLRTALTEAKALATEWRRGLRADHGVGLACGFWSTGTGAGGEATLRLSPGGLVIVEGEREIGSGSIVAGLVRIAAGVVQLPTEAIRVEYHDTSDAPFDTGVFGSRTLGALGQAVEKATKALLDDLAKRR